MSLVTGDVDGTLFGLVLLGSLRKRERRRCFMFSYDHLNVTDVAGVNLNGADIEQNSFLTESAIYLKEIELTLSLILEYLMQRLV